MKHAFPIAALACAVVSAALLMAPAAPARAQEPATWRAHAPYSQQELDQMLAPIALYPDALLAQVLMAATYPLEVVQAARFMQRNPGLAGDTLARAIEPMQWDPSVAALTQFPSVLAMMNEELEWTERLGEAFLAQRDEVMDTIQMLRDRAWAAGTLRPNDQQNVIVRERVYVIESWRPGYFWVPYYNPLIVFGTWWWPAYPPFLWVPPVIYRPPYFPQVYSVGIVWGPAVLVLNSLWSDPVPVWRDRSVVIGAQPVTNVIVTGGRTPRPVIWQHDPNHRRNVEYRTPALRGSAPPLFPEKPSRVSPSVQPSREPYYYPVPREPSMQVPREVRPVPDARPVPETRPVPDTRPMPRQQVPVKPPAVGPERTLPRQSLPSAPQSAPRQFAPAAPLPQQAVPRQPFPQQAVPRQPSQPQFQQRAPQPQPPREIRQGGQSGGPVRQSVPLRQERP